jgi:Type II secretion system (T2SS), protein F
VSLGLIQVLAASCAAAAVTAGGGGSAGRRLAVLVGRRQRIPATPGHRRWPTRRGPGLRAPGAGGRTAAGDSADLALFVDLLAAGLAAGASVPEALAAVSGALPGVVADRLRPVVAALSLGAAPEPAWAPLRSDPALRPLASTLTRAGVTGAPPVDALVELAADLRARRRLAATEAARTAGVRAVAPLGLCFLPAFVLVGVVPTVVGLAAAALGGG